MWYANNGSVKLVPYQQAKKHAIYCDEYKIMLHLSQQFILEPIWACGRDGGWGYSYDTQTG